MAVKYVKDFEFPSSAGFHGAPKHFAKGGAVKAPASTMKREMTKSNKLSGNTGLPKIPDTDIYKQSGGAGTKLMPGYKKGGQVQKYAKGGYPGVPGMPGVGSTLKKGEKETAKSRAAEYASESSRMAKEEAKPLSRLKKFAEDTSADIKQAYKSNIKKPLLKAATEAEKKLGKGLARTPGRFGKAGALATLGGAAALKYMMGDDDEAETKPLASSSKSLAEVRDEMEEIPVTATRRTESVTTPVKVTKPTRKPSAPASGVEAVIAYNRKNNPDFDASMEREIRERFSKPSEEGMKRGGKVGKYAEGGKPKMSPGSMSDRDAEMAKRGIDPYAERSRGLGKMGEMEAERLSKELRQKYGKKDEPVKHPGGRQRFLSGQIERAPMKKGGKAESSKEDMKQDRAMMARHNRLMHPGQKSKLKHGGKAVPSYNGKPMVKKAGGGNCY